MAASLPGGDPLGEALAAGETPSPELVAAVGGTDGLRPVVAVVCLATVVAGIALAAWLGDRASPFFLELDKAPEVLAQEAQELVAELGPVPPPADRAQGFFREGGQLGTRRLVFWYRQSPRSLSEGRRYHGGPLSFTHPAFEVPGMVGVQLDPHGVLIEYVRVPTQDESNSRADPDWGSVLRRAGLDPIAALDTSPTSIPPVFADKRYAWDIDAKGGPIRAEAASFHGRPVWFKVMDPSVAPSDTSTVEPRFIYIALALVFLAMVVARRNVRMGRGDREGAVRIAAFAAFGAFVGSALLEPRKLEAPLVGLYVMNGLLWTAATWVAYLALEPAVRRRWPDTVVSWTRLLRGRLLDPLVGRDVLIGCLGGVAITLIRQVAILVREVDAVRWPASSDLLAGGWYVLGYLITGCGNAVLLCLFVLMLLALLRQLVRKAWAAVVGTLALLLIWALAPGNLITVVAQLVWWSVLLGLIVRPGLLAAVGAVSVYYFIGDVLITTHLGSWYADSAVAGCLATLAVSAWGFYAAIGGRSVFGTPGREVA